MRNLLFRLSRRTTQISQIDFELLRLSAYICGWMPSCNLRVLLVNAYAVFRIPVRVCVNAPSTEYAPPPRINSARAITSASR